MKISVLKNSKIVKFYGFNILLVSLLNESILLNKSSRFKEDLMGISFTIFSLLLLIFEDKITHSNAIFFKLCFDWLILICLSINNFDVIIITLQNDVSQQNKTYSNTGIAFEWE